MDLFDFLSHQIAELNASEIKYNISITSRMESLHEFSALCILYSKKQMFNQVELKMLVLFTFSVSAYIKKHFFFFLVTLHCLWDLSALTRD